MLWLSSRVHANRWSSSDRLRGEAGLHAFWRIRGPLKPEVRDEAVVHCLAEGRCRVGALGLRAEYLTIQQILLHPATPEELLQLVQLRYPGVTVCRAKIGPCRILTADGNLYSVDEEGLFHGQKRFYDGTVLRFRHGQQHGISRHKDGSIERWHCGQRHGTWRYADGRIERYRYGEKHGLWILPDGSRIRYRHDLRHGTWRFADGYIERYYKGKKHGLCILPDGSRIRYRHDLRHGTWRFANGSVERYLDGDRHGKWVLPNGEVVYYYHGKLRDHHEAITATK
jgi:hypothetical protein